MAKGQLPPGIRFHPTDVELLMYYLRRKVQGKKLLFPGISVVDILKYDPWDLPDKSGWRSGDRKWYFFCLREKKYASGSRMNRSTDRGYWKTTGKDRSVKYKSNVIGMIKTLVFHLGKAPHGNRTNWVMYEYSLQDNDLESKRVNSTTYVLCAVFEKDGKGPRNGAQYGAPFREEDWNDDDDDHNTDVDVGDDCSNLLQYAINTAMPVDSTVPPNMILLGVGDENPSDLPLLECSATLGSLASNSHADNIHQVPRAEEDDEVGILLSSFGNDDYSLCNDAGRYLCSPGGLDKHFADAATSNVMCAMNSAGDDGSFMELSDLDWPLCDSEACGELPAHDIYADCDFYGFMSSDSLCTNLLPYSQSTPAVIAKECEPCVENARSVGENEICTCEKTREMKIFVFKSSLIMESILPCFFVELEALLFMLACSNDGISVYFKAEVTLKIDGCTKDALIHLAGVALLYVVSLIVSLTFVYCMFVLNLCSLYSKWFMPIALDLFSGCTPVIC